MQVRIYDVDANGNQSLRTPQCDLLDCFDYSDPERYTARHHLEREGRYWTGGGATALVLLTRVVDAPPFSF
jgi:hypothetical protein